MMLLAYRCASAIDEFASLADYARLLTNKRMSLRLPSLI
jgi:hypothetical protein